MHALRRLGDIGEHMVVIDRQPRRRFRSPLRCQASYGRAIALGARHQGFFRRPGDRQQMDPLRVILGRKHQRGEIEPRRQVEPAIDRPARWTAGQSSQGSLSSLLRPSFLLKNTFFYLLQLSVNVSVIHRTDGKLLGGHHRREKFGTIVVRDNCAARALSSVGGIHAHDPVG